MYLNDQKEEFSYAYIHAIASVAGYAFSTKSRRMDSAGVDVTIETPSEIGEVLFPKIEAQVKCTASLSMVSESGFSFPLPVRNYNRLRHLNSLVPLILIVVVVPSDLPRWLEINEEQTLLRKCAYWVSLKGKEPTDNTTTVSVYLPRSNLLTPQSLSELMKKVAQREDL